MTDKKDLVNKIASKINTEVWELLIDVMIQEEKIDGDDTPINQEFDSKGAELLFEALLEGY